MSNASKEVNTVGMAKEPKTQSGAGAPVPKPVRKAPFGLRTVALFELIKGVLFAVIALGAASLFHRDVEVEAVNLVRVLHLDPAWHFTHALIQASSKLTETRLRLVAIFASLLALIRFAESYGLWQGLAWAKWFAVISAAIYLPLEIYRFWHDPRLAGAIVFLINVVIVVYLARLLAESRRQKRAAGHGLLP